jgi:hypothetical protein
MAHFQKIFIHTIVYRIVMAKNDLSAVFWIGIVGLLLYSLSTADWSKIANLLEQLGKLLFGGAVLYALSQLLNK